MIPLVVVKTLKKTSGHFWTGSVDSQSKFEVFIRVVPQHGHCDLSCNLSSDQSGCTVNKNPIVTISSVGGLNVNPTKTGFSAENIYCSELENVLQQYGRFFVL